MFVTFEGPEGGGKSTALASVASGLRDKGREVIATREPGAGPLGSRIRDLLLHGGEVSPETELLLFLADRANHIATIIRPALSQGAIVLCDRFSDSSLVYQGMARGLEEDFIRRANRFATSGLVPDLTLLFDLPPEVGLARVKDPDRIDRQPLAFHEAVRKGFQRLAAEEPRRWITIDATQESAAIAAQALTAIESRIRRD